MATVTATRRAKPKQQPMPWHVVEKSRNVHEFRTSLAAGREAWLLWMSDEHWDHPKCRLDILKRHHEEALERGALIVKVGDTFCAMQGKGDPRGDKGSVRPEHQKGNYLDALVETATNWYTPYAGNIGVIGLGNHETSIWKHHETCLIDRLCSRLQDRGGIARKGGYGGWIRCMFKSNGTRHQSFRTFYNHGWGGGGPVTKGVIDFNRMHEHGVADAYVSGHVHYKNVIPNERAVLNESSVVEVRKYYDVRCGTYKDEWEDGYAGFHVEKGRGPRPLGGWWQRFYTQGDKVKCEWTEAAA